MTLQYRDRGVTLPAAPRLPDLDLIDYEDGPATAQVIAHPGGWYLFTIAVAAHVRGRGLGTALLRHILADADAAGVAVTLVPVAAPQDDRAAEDRLRRWYARHGFRDEPGRQRLADGKVVRGMRREPRGAGDGPPA